jgi:hypothetical protein
MLRAAADTACRCTSAHEFFKVSLQYYSYWNSLMWIAELVGRVPGHLLFQPLPLDGVPPPGKKQQRGLNNDNKCQR